MSERPCPCGSGLPSDHLYDARGISCGRVCAKCEKTKRAKYDPRIFASPRYWTDEPVEEGDSYGDPGENYDV